MSPVSTTTRLPFITLLLLISFAAVNALLFTPALPAISHYFGITPKVAQQTITWFLIGYALGQLVYGPIASRFGRKRAIYVGIVLQIISSFLCVFSGYIHSYSLLVLARFLLALGSGVGLKMTFTLVNESYESKEAGKKISYLMLAFAITPGLSVAMGGILNEHFGWMSCFYAGAVYGLLLLFLVKRFPETGKAHDVNALKIKHLYHNYADQFRNAQLVLGGLLMGSATCFIYIFAAIAPFIAIKLFGMSSSHYGLANILLPVGMITGSLVSAKLSNKRSLKFTLGLGVTMATVGVMGMFLAMIFHFPVLVCLFFPMVFVYFGICCILANASTIALGSVEDKAHGSSVMNFINMGYATLFILGLGFFPLQALTLPFVYLFVCLLMLAFYVKLMR